MPRDEALEHRMRLALEAHAGLSEKHMMGGTCFFLNGNMLSGARRDRDGVRRFMFRVGKAQEDEALADPAASPVIHGTRRLGGFVLVADSDCGDDDLRRWLGLCLAHAAALPHKD